MFNNLKKYFKMIKTFKITLINILIKIKHILIKINIQLMDKYINKNNRI